MAYDTWPPGDSDCPFPQCSFLGTRQTFDSATVSFRVSWGPAKVRRAGTRDREFHSTPMELTGAQLSIFNTWFDSTLAGGTKKFTWTNMITGDAGAVYRFQSDDQGKVKRPSWELIIPSSNFDTTPGDGATVQRIYSGMIELELLPE